MSQRPCLRQGARPAILFVVAAFAASSALAQGNCKLSEVVEWTVREGRGHLVVDGAINGAPVGIVLDTGATASIVLRKTAIRLDLPRREAKGRRMYGVGGETRVEVADIDDFTLGNVSTKGLSLYVAGEIDFGPGRDMLLGADFLSHFDIEFDLPSHKVRLFRPSGCNDVSLAYWTKETPGQVALEEATEARPRVAFTVEVNDMRIPAVLDSGAPGSVLSKAHAEAVGVVPGGAGVTASRPMGGLGARSAPSWIGMFTTFAIGNESMPDVRIRFSDLYADTSHATTGSRIARNVAPTQPMLLGADFLRAHRTYVANSQRRMYFTYTGGPVFRVD